MELAADSREQAGEGERGSLLLCKDAELNSGPFASPVRFSK